MGKIINIQMNRETYDKVMAYLAENGGGTEPEPEEPKLPKNFIKFAPYSTDIYPESFVPQPISINAVDDSGIIVFDDNVTEITVESEAFCNAVPSSIEFCENVKYIKSTAFDNCEYTEIKFHSIVPPEFSWGFGNLMTTMSFNGIIYYPAGSDYSSLRSVTTDFGNKLLFENFEFVEFNPSQTPQYDSDFLEMHFEIKTEFGFVDSTAPGYEGYKYGDYSKEFNELKEFSEKYKVHMYDDNYSVPSEIVLEKTNITFNGFRVHTIEYYYYSEDNCEFVLYTNAPEVHPGYNPGIVTPTYIYFAHGEIK